MKATYHKPSGFRDPPFYDSEVEIVGYCFGYHQDGQSPNVGGATALAIFINDGRFDFAPVKQFRSLPAPPSGEAL